MYNRFFKKTDTGLKESLKKESIASYDPAGGSGGDGKVRVDKTYRDPGALLLICFFASCPRLSESKKSSMMMNTNPCN